MGPLRTGWTFPYTGKELIETCKAREAEIVAEIDASLDAEQQHELDLAEYRERLRNAGVRGWENAQMEQKKDHFSNPLSAMRQKQGQLSKKLTEVQRFRRQLEHDLERDEFRLYKLSIDDVVYFGL
jgi:predicted nuclease with TOPRIM domain